MSSSKSTTDRYPVEDAENRLLAPLIEEHARCLQWLLRVEAAIQTIRPGALTRDPYEIVRRFLIRCGSPQRRDDCIQAIIDGGGVLMAQNKVKEAGKSITFRVGSGELIRDGEMISLPEWHSKAKASSEGSHS